ncbi:hypothetical protein HGRIS_014018 [Hohenbuehelia grisea]|uniref:Hydrophobin n=1 Tax=Hohenbuehelia grisea TaxID=104357 RepID=A0ABR3JT27_9AGAR
MTNKELALRIQVSKPQRLTKPCSRSSPLSSPLSIFFTPLAMAASYYPGHNGTIPHTHPPPPAQASCGNTRALQCCNSLQESDSASVSSIFDLLGTDPSISGTTAQVGFACSPIVGDTGLAGSTACAQQTACCSDTHPEYP